MCGMSFKVAKALIELVDKSCGIGWTVIGNPAEDGDKVVNGNRKVTEDVIICHASAAEVFSLLEYG